MTSAISHLNTPLDKKIATALELKNPEKGISILLRFLGEMYQSDRSYIFEFHETNTLSNTYEWCAEDVVPQIENLQNESLFHVTYWIEKFENNSPVIISDLEDIRLSHPATYAILKPQQIRSLVAVPFYSEEKIIGFVGIDNPKKEDMSVITQTLYYCGSILSHLIHTRKIHETTVFYQFHDPQTHFYNLAALKRYLENPLPLSSLGIVACEISKFDSKIVNFSYDGTDDYSIFEWTSILKHVFHDCKIYQICPESYIIFCEDISNKDFQKAISLLREFASRNTYQLYIGHFWDNSDPVDAIEAYANARNRLELQISHSQTASAKAGGDALALLQNNDWKELTRTSDNSALDTFVANNYFDLNAFVQSMSVGGLYPYFGNLTSDLWYISDSMRDLFGFQNNIVIDLIHKWENFIPYKDDLELYRSDIEKIVSLKKDIHDLVYRINDKDGNELWIRCFGLITWNSDRSAPLSFCGNVFRLNHAFLVDPVTNFPREKPAIREIGKLQQLNQDYVFICFRFNGFSEINELNGRQTADELLKDITSKIAKSFDKEILFYRLDGLRFLAILPQKYIDSKTEIAERIRAIASGSYSDYNLPIRVPCSVGILNDICKNVSAQEIMTDVMSVLEIAKDTPDVILTHSIHTVRSHREKKQMAIDLSNDVSNQFRNFRVLIQPIVSAKTHKIIGGEVLLRWKYEGRDISPTEFIPILEESKLILPVGRWVFDQAARHCKRINSYHPDFFLDFNVSYHQINDAGLLDYMKSTLEKRQLSNNHLIMELTETQYNHKPLKLQQFLDNCVKMGIPMALDDFGVGYSSLEILLKYPAKVVKLDRSLMKKMSDSKDISDFMTSIVYACHKFGKLVCVEGVETEKELQIVTEAGCDYIQGYYFYKPMEIDVFYELMAGKN